MFYIYNSNDNLGLFTHRPNPNLGLYTHKIKILTLAQTQSQLLVIFFSSSYLCWQLKHDVM